RSILVLCGPGNNGGDGYVCASELRALGHRVRCVASAAPATDEAAIARARWSSRTMSQVPNAAGGPVADVVVDALFGIGLRRPVEGPFAEQLAWLREQPAPIVALDVPSGLDADTGAWVGAVPGVCATSTISFLGAKPGLYTGAGAEAAGRVLVDDLGASAWRVATDGRLNAPDEFAAVARPRPRTAHKGSHGNVAIVGGSGGMVGAALLAARAALRLGAGRVFVECIGAPELRFDPAQPELMFRHRDAALLRSLQALVIGCGLGTSAEALAATQLALEQDCAVVLDADALNLIASAPQLERAARRPTRGVRICTPHPLEAARLLGSSVDEVQRDRVAAARRLAERLSSAI
ncbi:MAG: NAD(P)H-hydrate epimerase, partial [Betaproteobacteria bacterium]